MNFNIFNSLILAGCIQGFVFALIWLFNKKYRAQGTYYLIALIIVYSLSNLQYYLLDIGLFDPVKFYDLYLVHLPLIFPPLLLLYGLSLIHNKNYPIKKYWKFFIPFILIILLSFYYKFQLLFGGKESGYNQFLDQIPSWGEYVAMVYSIIVIVYLIRKIKVAGAIRSFSITEIKPELKWFRNILFFQLFSTTLWAASEIAFGDGYESFYYYPLWIILAVIIYWMGHTGIYKYGVQEERKQIRKITKDSGPRITVEKSKNEYILQIEKILIEEKNFLDPSISLESLAEKMELSKGYLSKIINSELQMSFKEYLNNLRIEEAKSYLSNPEFSNYTLVAIGLEAGFSSKSAFNATFKKMTGMTPSAYKTKHAN